MQQPDSNANGNANATTTTGEVESRLSALLKEAKATKGRLRALRQESNAQRNPHLELTRKQLRNVYLKLLFNFPFSSRTGGVEVDLWTETCHPGVHTYRSILTQLEKQIKDVQAKKTQHSTNRQNSSNEAVYRQEAQLNQRHIRVAGNFRSYLAAEETFWKELLGRVVKVFGVTEAKPHVEAIGVVCDGHNLASEAESSTGLGRITGANSEGGELEVQGRLPANRIILIAIIHKSLLCSGDLARYQELYKEEKVDETMIVQTRNAQRGGRRGGRGGSQLARPTFSSDKKAVRDYSKAAQCYEQARALLPSNGQPSNQIAVLAYYVGHSFAAVYHYYRSLCVTVPFDRAKQNLEAMLKRSVEEWTSHGKPQAIMKPWEDAEKRRSALLNDLVVLHGHFFLTSQGPIPTEFVQNNHHILSNLMIERILSADTIVQIVTTAIASLWTRRLWRGTSAKEQGTLATNNVNTELEIMLHLIGVMTVMVQVGFSETREAMESAKRHPPSEPSGSSDQSSTMVKNITAAFRRMLPALRIASKWLKSHVEYVERSRSHQRKSELSDQESSQAEEISKQQKEKLSEAVDELWLHYVNFVNTIRFAFPFDRLPKFGTIGQSGMTNLSFEEDRDMRGFVPMKKAMLIDAKIDATTLEAAGVENQLHPNEEHLVRIADILIDAKVIAESDSSPIAFDDDQNNFYFVSARQKSQTDSSLAKSSVVNVPEIDQSLSRSLDGNWENGSESTEDAVDLAMRAVDERRRALGNGNALAGEEQEDEDEDDGEIILIPSVSRQVAKSRSDVSTASPSGSVSVAVPVKETSVEEPLTAQHLLLQMINGSNKNSSKPNSSRMIPSPSPSTPQPHLLFGGIASSNSQGSLGSLAHHGGAWDGNEAMQFMNQQHRGSQQLNGKALPQPAFPSSSPWDPPSRDGKGADWR